MAPVAEAVDTDGLAALGLLVLSTGLLQLVLGLAGMGDGSGRSRYPSSKACSPESPAALILGQLYRPCPHGRSASFSGIVHRACRRIRRHAALLYHRADSLRRRSSEASWSSTSGAGCPPGSAFSPAPLAVILASAVTTVFDLPVATVKVSGLLDANDFPGLGSGRLVEPGIIATILGITPSLRRRAFSAPQQWTGCTTVPAPISTRS